MNSVMQGTKVDACDQVFVQMAMNLQSQINGCFPEAPCDTHATHGLPSAVMWVKQGLMGATVNNMVVLSKNRVGDGIL